MGTDCAPFMANLYLYAYESKYLNKLRKNDRQNARKFANSFRFLDDLLTINNDNLFHERKHEIYPPELTLTQTNTDDKHAPFLDLKLEIINKRLQTTLYDKRDDFKFTINSFPNLSAKIHKRRTHNVLIGSLIRFSKACTQVENFCKVSLALIEKLTAQFFDKKLLKKKFCYFYDSYYHLVARYKLTKNDFLRRLF